MGFGARGAISARSGGTLAADAALLGVALVWGASYPVAKGALAVAPVFVLVVLRFALSGLLTAAVARSELALAPYADLARGAVLGAILFLIFAAETFGVARTTATNAAFLISLCTVLTPIMDDGLSGRLPPPAVLVGAALCCSGAAVLGGGLSGFNGGDGLILCAAVLRACMVIATKRLMAGRPLSSVALTAVQSATVTLLSALALLATPGGTAFRSETGPAFWMAVLFLSLFCTVGALFVQNAAVRRTTPTRVSFLLGTEPVFGLLFARALIGEPFSGRNMVGGALIVVGTVMGLRRISRLP